MSDVLVFSAYGGPEVLHVVDLDPGTPGPQQIRVRVHAAGIQPFDCLFRSGAARQWVPATFPQRIGNELAGVVEAVGAEVTTVAVGDHVLGWAMLAGAAAHVIVAADQVVARPAGMPWLEAGALSASGQTASTALDRLGVRAGETLLIHAAAGGVGSFAVQLARALGAHVIGTASERNHDYLRSLGATPVRYGDGLIDRIRAAAPHGVDAALIGVGADEAVRTSRELVARPQRIGTLGFHPLAAQLGIARISTERSIARLTALVTQYTEGSLKVEIERAYPLAEAAAAHHRMETGHVRGKLVFQVS